MSDKTAVASSQALRRPPSSSKAVFQQEVASRQWLAWSRGAAVRARKPKLTEASYAQNEEIKKISAWAAIFFVPTLIGTVYGMNFDHMSCTG